MNGVAVSASLVVFQSIGEGGGIASEAEVVACVWCKHYRARHIEAMEVALQRGRCHRQIVLVEVVTRRE